MINLNFKTEKNGIAPNAHEEIYTLVQINSDEKRKDRERSPLNIAIALDRSGSMHGRPLSEAKLCIEMMIDRLSSEDHFSLITYDNDVDVVVPATKASNKEWLKAHVRSIRSGGMTALYDGWSSAAAEAAKNVTKKSISRVLLLSDGQANEGLTDQAEIASHCAQMASVGVSTTTYGLSENFNENLMSAMAKSGKGMAHYGQTADDLADPFQSEFDLINALTARDLKLHLIAEPGVELEVMNKFQRNLDGSFVISDLAEGGELWALLKIKVSKSNLNRATDGKLRILSAFLDYKNMEGESCRTEQSHLNLDLISDAAFAALETEELVSLRKVELEAANLQDAARVAARRHDWNEVNELVAQLDVLGVENEWVKESTKKLREYADRRETERFSKEAFYKSDRMRSRMGIMNESACYSPELEAMEVPSFLRRKVEVGKKSQANRRDP
jgi:Ca-activated chloride channel family protein